MYCSFLLLYLLPLLIVLTTYIGAARINTTVNAQNRAGPPWSGFRIVSNIALMSRIQAPAFTPPRPPLPPLTEIVSTSLSSQPYNIPPPPFLKLAGILETEEPY